MVTPTSSKKRKTATPDKDEDRGFNLTGPSPYPKTKRVGQLNMPRINNTGFVALKDKLHRAAVQEILESDVYQKLFSARGPRLPNSCTTAGTPEFVNASLVDLSWDLKAIKDMYARNVGDVIAMGMEDVGQLGLIQHIGKERTDGFPPQVLRNMVPVVQVAAGGMHSAALTQEGQVYTWGCGDDGGLARVWTLEGDDEEEKYTTPPTPVTHLIPSLKHAASQHPVRSPDNEAKDVIQIACGTSHTAFLTVSGNVYCCGIYKDLDSGKFSDIRAPDDPTTHEKEPEHDCCEGIRFLPVHIWRMPGRAKYVDAGGSFCAAILEDGEVVTWGMGHSGELARSEGATDLIDKETNGPDLGHRFYREVKDGKKFYRLDKVNEHFLTPKPVQWFGGMPRPVVTHLSCGGQHFLVAARKSHESSSRLYSTGLNNYGKLGHGDEVGRHKVTLVEALKDIPIAKVAAGLDHSLILNAKGDTIYACGRGGYGQLGIPKSELQTKSGGQLSADKLEGFSLVPKVVAFPTTDRVYEIGRFVDIKCGENHSVAITSGGKIYSWGYGEYGQCGNNPRVNSDDLMQPRLNEDWLKEQIVVHDFAGGSQHSLVVASRYTKK